MIKPTAKSIAGLANFLEGPHLDQVSNWFKIWYPTESLSLNFLLKREWQAMTEFERSPFYCKENASTRGISKEDVLSNRNILHQKYHSRDLHFLEFIAKTRPRVPKGIKYWLCRLKEQNIRVEGCRKFELSDPVVLRLCEGCAGLDKRRYSYQKSAWFATIIQIDRYKDNFTEESFYSTAIEKCEEQFNEAIRNSDQPGPMRFRRPRGPFSLWIEDYRYMIREEKPEFRFGDHLRMCSESWSMLPEDKKKELKDRSEQLKRDYLEQAKVNEQKFNLNRSEAAYRDIFKHEKNRYVSHPSHLIPHVPSARDIFAKERQISNKSVALKLWTSLSDEEKQPFTMKREEIRRKQAEKREQVKHQVQEVKNLVRQAQELVRLKRNLGLVDQDKKDIFID